MSKLSLLLDMGHNEKSPTAQHFHDPLETEKGVWDPDVFRPSYPFLELHRTLLIRPVDALCASSTEGTSSYHM